MQIFVNGRFITRQLTGVDRVAIELVQALARDSKVSSVAVIHPKSNHLHVDFISNLDPRSKRKITFSEYGRLQGHLWEQLELPFFSPKEILFSFCSTGPAFRQTHAVLIHDTQVWDARESYTFLFRLLYKLLLPLIGHRAKYVFTGSHYSSDRLEILSVVPKAKLKVVYHGSNHILKSQADESILKKLNVSEKPFFLAINGMAPHKNINRLIEVYRDQKNELPELIVVGASNIRVFATTNSCLPSNVRFVGRVSDAELRALYEAALALLFPSLTEGFGLPPIEAMRCGCPVIASTSGAVPEICGSAALYVDPDDTRGWISAMILIKNDAMLRNKVIQDGLEQSETFCWDKAAKEVLSSIFVG